MAITGRKRKKRPCRRGGSSPSRDVQPVGADPSSPVGGVQSAAHTTTDARDRDPSANPATGPLAGSFFLSGSGSTSTRRSARLFRRPTNSENPEGTQILRKFKTFLQGCCEKIANDMWDDSILEMEISFADIRRKDRPLSFDIVNNHNKMQEELQDAVLEYLITQYTSKDFSQRFSSLEIMQKYMKENVKLILVGVPDSIEELKNALDLRHGCVSSNYRTLFSKHPKRKYKVPTVTDSQLEILIGSLDHLLERHKEGLSYGGAWRMKDWDLVNGKPHLFAPAESGDANQTLCKLDLARFAKKFIRPFGGQGGRYPANFIGLYRELINPMQLANNAFFGWYYEFLSFYVCFFTGSARMTLVRGWYHLVCYLRYDQNPAYSGVLNRRWLWTVRFQKKANVPYMLWRVFWNGKKARKDLPYQDTLGHNFLLIRQLQEHTYRCSKLVGGEQAIVKSDEPDLYAEDQFPLALAELIKSLFIENKMVGEFLERWEEFKKLRGPPSRRGG